MKFELPIAFQGVQVISSEKSDGPMNFNINNNANLRSYLERNGIDCPLAFPEQVHQDRVVFCDQPGRQEGADGVAATGRFVLATKSADCLPLLFYAPAQSLIGAVHVSRHNLVSGIVDHAVDLLTEKNVDLKSSFFFFGPHIRKANYPLSKDGLQSLSGSLFNQFIAADGKFDLTASVFEALERRGIMRENITDCEIDTYTDDRFFSSRADQHDGPVSVFASIIYKTK